MGPSWRGPGCRSRASNATRANEQRSYYQRVTSYVPYTYPGGGDDHAQQLLLGAGTTYRYKLLLRSCSWRLQTVAYSTGQLLAPKRSATRSPATRTHRAEAGVYATTRHVLSAITTCCQNAAGRPDLDLPPGAQARARAGDQTGCAAGSRSPPSAVTVRCPKAAPAARSIPCRGRLPPRRPTVALSAAERTGAGHPNRARIDRDRHAARATKSRATV